MTYVMNSMAGPQWGRRMRMAFVLALSLGALTGCDGLLEVELPAQLGDDAVTDPAGAQTLVNTVIGHFENGYNRKTAFSTGLEVGCEVLLRSPGVEDFCDYDTEIDDDNGEGGGLYFSTSIGRAMAYLLQEKLEEWTVADVPRRAEFLPISSIYAGATLEVMAETLCEITIDGGELMTPSQTYTLAETWLTRALGQIQTDFALPHGVSSSAQALAYGLRARIRWALGNDAGALSDALQVPEGFVAYATRQPGVARMNLIANHTQGTGNAKLYAMVDWWTGPGFNGTVWPTSPDPIPFTGWHYLGILPDGRAVTDGGIPIRVTDDDGGKRTEVFGPDLHPGLEATAVRDTRVPHNFGILQGSGEDRLFQNKWRSEDDDIPWVTWKEMQLIAAELEGGQGAIDRVNAVRSTSNLPLVTYADPNNAQQIRYMIIEERRRAFFVEGRYYATELQNTDIIWFPRNTGSAQEVGDAYGGAVKRLMPSDEYNLNPNISLADRGTGCAADLRPVGFS